MIALRRVLISIIFLSLALSPVGAAPAEGDFESLVHETREPMLTPQLDRLWDAFNELVKEHDKALDEYLKPRRPFDVRPHRGRWLVFIPAASEPWQVFHNVMFVSRLEQISGIDLPNPRFINIGEADAERFQTGLDNTGYFEELEDARPWHGGIWQERMSMAGVSKALVDDSSALLANPDANIPAVAPSGHYNVFQKLDGLYAGGFVHTKRFLSELHRELDNIYRSGEKALGLWSTDFPPDPWANPQPIPDEYLDLFKGDSSTHVSLPKRAFRYFANMIRPRALETPDLTKSFLTDVQMSREELSFLVRVIAQALLNYDDIWNDRYFDELPTEQRECFTDMTRQGDRPYKSGMCLKLKQVRIDACRCLKEEKYDPQPKFSKTEICSWGIDWDRAGLAHGPRYVETTWIGDIGDFFADIGGAIWGAAEWLWDQVKETPSRIKNAYLATKRWLNDHGVCEVQIKSEPPYIAVRGGSYCGTPPENIDGWRSVACGADEFWGCPIVYQSEGVDQECLGDQVKRFIAKADLMNRAAHDNAYGPKRYLRHVLSEVMRYAVPDILPVPEGEGELPAYRLYPRYKISYSYFIPGDKIGYHKRPGEIAPPEVQHQQYYPWDANYQVQRQAEGYIKLNALLRPGSFYDKQMSPAEKAAILTHFLVNILQDMRDRDRQEGARLGTNEVEADLAAALVLKYAPKTYQETPGSYRKVSLEEDAGHLIPPGEEPTLPWSAWTDQTGMPEVKAGNCLSEFSIDPKFSSLPYFTPLGGEELERLSMYVRQVNERLYGDMARRRFGEFGESGEFGSQAFQLAHWVGKRLEELAVHLQNAATGREDDLVFTRLERSGDTSKLLIRPDFKQEGVHPKAEIAIGESLVLFKEGNRWNRIEETLGAMLHQYIHWFMASHDFPRTPYWEETNALLAQAVTLITAAGLNPDRRGAEPSALRVALNALLDDNPAGARLAAAAASGMFGKTPAELSRHEIDAMRKTR